jgi:protein SCO1/2
MLNRGAHIPQKAPSRTIRSSRIASVVVSLAALVALVPGTAQAVRFRVAPNYDAPTVIPRQVQDVGIDDRAGQPLPKDLVFKDENGKQVAFESLFNGKQPVVLVLAYYTCPMLCTVVLNGLTNGLKEVGWTVGNEFRVVTVSIDPNDTPEIAKAKRANYIEEYGRLVRPDGWNFLTGDEANIKKLADALGFRYHWDDVHKQYNHAAGSFILTPDGRISRTLYGISFPGKDLRLALVEASNGAFASAVDRLLLFCFHYEAKSGKYVLAATRVMQVGGTLTAIILGIWLVRVWRRESLRTAAT